MQRAENYLENAEENGNTVATRRALAKTIVFQNRVEAHEEKALEIKERILENKADTMTEEQLAHLEEVFSNVEDRAEMAQNRIVQRQENLKLKYKALTGMTDEEIEDSMETYNSFLEQNRELRQQRIQEIFSELFLI